MDRITTFSHCRRYRYSLWRHFDDLFPRDETGRFVAFIGLNPSTADETLDDPTIRRCIQFAKDWGFGSFCMLNLFAFRATDPMDMKAQIDPVGIENDHWLVTVSRESALVVAAWGNDGSYQSRSTHVISMLGSKQIKLHCLGVTATKEPKHPLYLKKDIKPIPLL